MKNEDGLYLSVDEKKSYAVVLQALVEFCSTQREFNKEIINSIELLSKECKDRNTKIAKLLENFERRLYKLERDSLQFVANEFTRVQ